MLNISEETPLSRANAIKSLESEFAKTNNSADSLSVQHFSRDELLLLSEIVAKSQEQISKASGVMLISMADVVKDQIKKLEELNNKILSYVENK